MALMGHRRTEMRCNVALLLSNQILLEFESRNHLIFLTITQASDSKVTKLHAHCTYPISNKLKRDGLTKPKIRIHEDRGLASRINEIRPNSNYPCQQTMIGLR